MIDYGKPIKYDDKERARRDEIYKNEVLPMFDNNPDKVPPHLEPDFMEGWE